MIKMASKRGKRKYSRDEVAAIAMKGGKAGSKKRGNYAPESGTYPTQTEVFFSPTGSWDKLLKGRTVHPTHIGAWDKKPKGGVSPRRSTGVVIAEMLKENTGTHFLDSGMESNRHWQQNQGVDFEKVPAVSVDASAPDDISVTKDVYHFLNDHVEYSAGAEKLDKEFTKFCNLPDNKDKGWLELMEEFAKKKNDKSAYHTDDGVWGENTYNSENLLSQGLQYEIFGVDGTNYILLQIHGGCDVRGGYSAPKVFELSDIDMFIIDQRDIRATDGKHTWSSNDAGYSWDYDGQSFDYKKLGDGGIGRITPELSKSIEVRDGKVYSKLNGKEVSFG